jgi:ubiquitin C-terminal hydrolase
LEVLNEELSRTKTKAKYKELEGDPNKKSLRAIVISIAIQSEEWWSYYKEIDNSIVCDAFQGQAISATSCKKCGKMSVNFDNMWGLPLTFSSNATIYQMLLNTWKTETTVEGYYCSQCQKHRDCIKST